MFVEAVHEVAPVDDHVKTRAVAELYGIESVSTPLAFRSTVTTFTITLSSTELPLESVQVIIYVLGEFTITEATPEVDFAPDQELAPKLEDAEQELTFAEDQVKETDVPLTKVTVPSDPLAFKSTDRFPLILEVQV